MFYQKFGPCRTYASEKTSVYTQIHLARFESEVQYVYPMFGPCHYYALEKSSVYTQIHLAKF